jgi:hypothetical protein
MAAESVTYLQESTFNGFLDSICTERNNGHGFVPFVGAGLSSPSGIPIVWELQNYLSRCITRALGVDQSDAWNADSKGFGRKRFDELRRWMSGRRWQIHLTISTNM